MPEQGQSRNFRSPDHSESAHGCSHSLVLWVVPLAASPSSYSVMPKCLTPTVQLLNQQPWARCAAWRPGKGTANTPHYQAEIQAPALQPVVAHTPEPCIAAGCLLQAHLGITPLLFVTGRGKIQEVGSDLDAASWRAELHLASTNLSSLPSASSKSPPAATELQWQR